MDIPLFVLLVFVTSTVGQHGPNHEVETAFTENQIVSDVLSSPPEQIIQVNYPKSGKEVNLGNELAPVDVKEKPDVKYEADSNDYYTLIFTDPDAPSRANPVRREFRHWLIVNIPGSDVSKGQELTAYIGSGPPKDSGLHRYIFLLYKQPKKIDFEEKVVTNSEVGDRPLFSAKKFAEKYSLDLKAGNFYQAQYDDSVPALHKQLGLGQPPK